MEKCALLGDIYITTQRSLCHIIELYVTTIVASLLSVQSMQSVIVYFMTAHVHHALMLNLVIISTVTETQFKFV